MWEEEKVICCFATEVEDFYVAQSLIISGTSSHLQA